MHKFKKILTGVLVTAGVACLGGAAACTKDNKPNYYSLSFEGVGLDFVMQGALAEPDAAGNIFQSGTVKEGVTVSFKIIKGENTEGTPKIVTGDGVEIVPDENGVYSFVMSKDTVVKAEGLSKLCTLNLHRGEKVGTNNGEDVYEERRISYIGTDGNKLDDTVSLVEGSTVKFKLEISPYYKEFNADGSKAYTVVYGTEELVEDKDGYYTLPDVKGDEKGELHVSVNKLEEDDPFYLRAGCGKGTESDPYLISRPIDLFNIAALVNLGDHQSYNTAYYKLVEDIDMEGEQLFVIGDYSNENAIFAGHFDGNGKKISNFTITDEVINQSTFQKEYLMYTGLFGCAVATTSSPVEIENLTLENYEISVHPAASKLPSYVGSLVGSSIGLQVKNCHLKGGVMELNGNNNYMIYAGGMVGLMQAAYGLEVSYDSYVRSSSSEIAINGFGSPRSAGGIVGYLASADEKAIAYVVNSYSKGSVLGAMHDGGIVGTLGRFSTVANCYSAASVSATNHISGAATPAEYKVAYAGGIVGFAEEDTVVSSCFSANTNIIATSATQNTQSYAYNRKGDIAGNFVTQGFISSDSVPYYEYANKALSTGGKISEMNWSDKDWDFPTDGGLPQTKYSTADREFTVNLVNAATDEKITRTKTMPAGVPMYQWYEGALEEYYQSGNNRSWGYYLEKTAEGELKGKVPYGFVPACDSTTLYFKTADYSEVAGRYYVKSDEYDNVAYFELDGSGNMSFRRGGMNFTNVYAYDGNEVTLYDTCLGALLFGDEELNGSYFTVKGTKTSGGFDLNGIAYIVDLANSTAEETTYKTDEISLVAVKSNGAFKYGQYASADGTESFDFLENMTGLYENSNGEVISYTYEFTQGGLSIKTQDGTATGGSWNATVTDGVVTQAKGVAVSLKDVYAGVWKKSTNSLISYKFDGKDKLTYTVGKSAPVTVDYAVDAGTGRATFTLNDKACEAFIDGQTGFLNVDGETYFKGDGFIGSWYMTGVDERIELSLEGMGAGDYGYATVHYAGSRVVSIEAQYDVTQYTDRTVMRLYVKDALFGELSLSNDSKLISGRFYSYNNNAYYDNANFYLYDAFRGLWASNLSGIDSVSFNGKSAGANTEVTMKVGAETVRGTYALTDALTGTITAGEKKYNIALDELANKVTMTEVVESGTGASGQLAQRDGWYGVVLHDTNGKSYTFDGKGYLGGKVTVSDGTTLSYTVGADGSVTINDTPLSVVAGGLDYNGTVLSFDTGFNGNWLVSGDGEVLTVGEVNGEFIAKVTYGGTDYDFTYNPSEEALVYVEGSLNARITTTLKLEGRDGTEMSISRTGGEEEVYLNCVSEAMVDGYKGEYVAADNSKWVFDGLGNSVYGSGKVKYISASGEEFVYGYKVDEFGYPHITDSVGRKQMQFRPVDGDGYKKSGETQAYATVELNSLYGITVQGNIGGTTARLIFDGIDTLYSGDGTQGNAHVKRYTYKIFTSTRVELVDDSGVKYLGKIETTGRINYLNVTSYADLYAGRRVNVVVDGSSVDYVFKADGKLYRIIKDSDKAEEYEDVAEYDYEVVSAYSVTLTKDGKKYKGTITELTTGNRLTIAEFEEEDK